MNMNAHHTHTADCLAVNELNETCCLYLADDHLRNACRRTVLVRGVDDTVTVHTFTDDDDDACALALEHADIVPSTARVVYRDLDHQLDALAHPSYVRDVPNPL